MKTFKYMYVVLTALCPAMPTLAMQNNRFLLRALAAKTSAVVVDAKTDVVQAQPKESSDTQAIVKHPGADKPQDATDPSPKIKPPYRS